MTLTEAWARVVPLGNEFLQWDDGEHNCICSGFPAEGEFSLSWLDARILRLGFTVTEWGPVPETDGACGVEWCFDVVGPGGERIARGYAARLKKFRAKKSRVEPRLVVRYWKWEWFDFTPREEAALRRRPEGFYVTEADGAIRILPIPAMRVLESDCDGPLHWVYYEAGPLTVEMEKEIRARGWAALRDQARQFLRLMLVGPEIVSLRGDQSVIGDGVLFCALGPTHQKVGDVSSDYPEPGSAWVVPSLVLKLPPVPE